MSRWSRYRTVWVPSRRMDAFRSVLIAPAATSTDGPLDGLDVGPGDGSDLPAAEGELGEGVVAPPEPGAGVVVSRHSGHVGE